jgi:hypothetical protein
MIIHMPTSPAEGFANFPAFATDPHEVRDIANQQQMKTRITLIFQELAKDCGIFSCPSLFGSLFKAPSSGFVPLLLFTTTPVTPVGVSPSSSLFGSSSVIVSLEVGIKDLI